MYNIHRIQTFPGVRIVKEFFEYFEIPFSAEAESHYNNALKAFAENGDKILDFESLNIYTYMTQRLAKIRDELKQDERNIIYCYFLNSVIKAGNNAFIESLCKPKPSANSELFDTLPLFSLLYEVPGMCKRLADKGVPQKIIDDTCNMFENQVQDFIDLHGHYGIAPYVTWLLLFINNKNIRIGRFNIEMAAADKFFAFRKGSELCIMPHDVVFHKSGYCLGTVGFEDSDGSFTASVAETDGCYEGNPIVNALCMKEKLRLDKSEWEIIAKPGDKIISVHIPSGGRLDFDENTADLLYAAEIVTGHFGDFKLFYCDSWLLEPEIKKVIGKETNMTRFADRFTRFPSKSRGNDVFSYLFLTLSTNDIGALPEDSSMRRAIKAHLASGGHILNHKGIFTKEELEKCAK